MPTPQFRLCTEHQITEILTLFRVLIALVNVISIWNSFLLLWNNCRILRRMWLSESEVAQSCLTLFDPMDWSLPGSSVHGIFQARVLEWVAMPSCRGSSWLRDRIQISHIAGGCFTIWATREAHEDVINTVKKKKKRFAQRKCSSVFYKQFWPRKCWEWENCTGLWRIRWSKSGRKKVSLVKV